MRHASRGATGRVYLSIGVARTPQLAGPPRRYVGRTSSTTTALNTVNRHAGGNCGPGEQTWSRCSTGRLLGRRANGRRRWELSSLPCWFWWSPPQVGSPSRSLPPRPGSGRTRRRSTCREQQEMGKSVSPDIQMSFAGFSIDVLVRGTVCVIT